MRAAGHDPGMRTKSRYPLPYAILVAVVAAVVGAGIAGWATGNDKLSDACLLVLRAGMLAAIVIRGALMLRRRPAPRR